VLLLGLGEGYPGQVALERTARNHAAHPDEAGAPPPAALDPAGPATRAWRLAGDPAWFPGSAVPVRLSDDAGDYLCNSMLYAALAQPVAKAGFVHLPPQERSADADYVAALLPVVVTVIERNLAR
jgi:pyrrolidone-carboxylate peptidase